jgi:hypothetical protein
MESDPIQRREQLKPCGFRPAGARFIKPPRPIGEFDRENGAMASVKIGQVGAKGSDRRIFGASQATTGSERRGVPKKPGNEKAPPQRL